MDRKLLIGLIIVVLLLAGGAAYFALKDDSEDTEVQNAATSSQNTPAENSQKEEFSAKPTDSESFVATLDGTAGESQINATILYDGKGNAKYSGTTAGQTFEAYLSDGQYIACAQGQCIKVSGASQQVIDSDQFSYSQGDYDALKASAVYKGKQNCPDGSCDTWETTKDGYKTTIFVNNEGKISQLTTEGNNGSFKYTYEYKDVEIVLPKNVKTIPQ